MKRVNDWLKQAERDIEEAIYSKREVTMSYLVFITTIS